MIEGVGAIRSQVGRPEAAKLRQAAADAKLNDASARATVCGALIWSAFSAPAANRPIYDIIVQPWASFTPPENDSIEAPSAPIPKTFWTAFNQVITGPTEGYNALTITSAIASLGGQVSPEYGAIAEACARTAPHISDPGTKPMPERLTMDNIAAAPEGSLGNALHHMLVDNGYDPEVLDRDAIGLAGLPPGLRYLNTRILQMHDVWHLVAGYETTALHETAISSFQLAQFPHNYSAMYLATILTMSHLKNPEGFNVLMQGIAEAWVHGRSTPSLMDIEFEEVWSEPIPSIRKRFGIQPFVGSLPANLFEQMRAAARN